MEKFNDFYGVMIIQPVNREPFEILANWQYVPFTDCWYANDESFPDAICKKKEGSE